MTNQILVAYATRHGSTQEVAQAITTALREHGLQVEMHPAWEVSTLDGYSAVILGAPLYYGRWHRDACIFLKRHRMALSVRPVAIFALGPLSTAEAQWRAARELLDHALAKAPWLTPVAVEIFGGKIDPVKLHFPFNRMPPCDIRNLIVIRSWTDQLTAILPAAEHLIL